ncbi:MULTISPECIES: PP2C family protein-serine/threonine phosphatase [unclassified Neptuniibacter]|jgi:sigma-B regulation protein RsbU (phosphoserine phosphatase)|uniref:PP2C family protein-serine/threonine phosphatase n=1 Tax=unclassified Neptuniibacter TaxID=2630693 RepID=UPI0026E376CA|nr:MULTISPECIES: SpoIIE family protein phosphatase [unclassified Neptuniibacter]MDO6513683.1 SpoIIE family protein phosphatase [Neptuniibacter sp. 2_MG-2023]MDO6593824.1 SpoIIE family protein phosphatase [Neptuniibacter sp. 1_MG-2023]
MRDTYQTILLVDHVAEAIDSIVDACSHIELRPVKVSTAYNCDYAKELLNEHDFSLIIAGLSETFTVDDIASLAELHSPKPILVLMPEAKCDQVLLALRKGANDVFIQSEIAEKSADFSDSISKLLLLADLIEKKLHYRNELEKSLSELQIDQQAALQIQQNMLPDKELNVGGLLARYLLIPSLYLSGDFVDVVPIDADKTMFYLADVSGHGASSALVTVLLKNMTNRLVRNYNRSSSFDILSPVNTLYRINSELLDTGLGKHLSIFIGLFDSKEASLTYAVGGHHPMPILTDAVGTRFLEGRGMPVGLFPEPLFDERKLQLLDEFEITLFSDGILEMLPEGNMSAKEQRLIDVVIAANGAGPDVIKEALLPNIINDAPDDIAIMTVCRQ